MIPASFNAAALTVAPSSNLFKVSRFTIAYSLRVKFVNPLLGKRMNNGVCPPSNPGFLPPPDLAP